MFFMIKKINFIDSELLYIYIYFVKHILNHDIKSMDKKQNKLQSKIYQKISFITFYTLTKLNQFVLINPIKNFENKLTLILIKS